MLVTEKIGEPNTHIIALVCQTIYEDKLLNIDCGHNFDDLSSRDGSINHKILCLKDCSYEGNVFGMGLYSSKSHVCKAMMHSGN